MCTSEGRLQGMVPDRDMVVKVIAEGRDPARIKVAALADQPEVVTIGADDNVEEAVETMKRHKVRRLPVIDGHKLVAMVSQADIARALPDEKVGNWWESSARSTPAAWSPGDGAATSQDTTAARRSAASARRGSPRSPEAYHCPVACDEEPVQRIGELVGDQPGVEQKPMFCGVAVLVGANMALAASGEGGLLVRVGPPTQ